MLKILMFAAIWAFGIYQLVVVLSDPASQSFSDVIQMLSTLLVSSIFAVSLARTPLVKIYRHKRLLRGLLCVPLVLCVVAVSFVFIVIALSALSCAISIDRDVLPILLLVGVVWGICACRKKICWMYAARLKRAFPEVAATPHSEGKNTKRTKRAIFGTAAWILVPASLPVGFLLMFLSGLMFNYKGFEGWRCLALGVLPVVIALLLAPIFAVVALCRRESNPRVSVTFLCVYGAVVTLAVCSALGPPFPQIGGLFLILGWILRPLPKRPTEPV